MAAPAPAPAPAPPASEAPAAAEEEEEDPPFVLSDEQVSGERDDGGSRDLNYGIGDRIGGKGTGTSFGRDEGDLFIHPLLNDESTHVRMKIP